MDVNEHDILSKNTFGHKSKYFTFTVGPPDRKLAQTFNSNFLYIDLVSSLNNS